VSDPQTEWAQLLLRSLVEAGVRDAIISPGSRSTPLVWAASQTPGLSCHCLIDERSAGFYALGQARVSGLPSLLICTSGTALSHYYPAVIEARQASIPLIVLSADRPFELQHCGAHQTIDQTRLFGAYASYHDLGTPVPGRAALLGLRRAAWQAVAGALESPRGTVHLNFHAHKPLEPRPGTAAVELPLTRALPASRRSLSPALARAELDWLLDSLEQSECPLLICGASSIQDSPNPELVRRFAELTGSIVCAEAVSQLRFQLGSDSGQSVVSDAYDWLLESPSLKQQLLPDFALQVGATPVSASLERLISESASSLNYAICAVSGWPDPLHNSAQIIRCGASELLKATVAVLEQRERRERSSRWQLWRDANAVARTVIARHVEAGFGEAAAVAQLCAALPTGSLFALGNSLPPRLVDRYCPTAARRIDICSQRGASGIEGAIAGVLGSASQTSAATTLLLGDISFLHDVGSLWAAQASRTHGAPLAQPVVIVVLNNGGGRIFEQLPIAADPSVDLHWWTTPHALRLGAAAELYGIGFSQVTAPEPFARALATAYAHPGVSLIEVVVAPDSARLSLREVGLELEPLFAALLQARPA
jgi:2-succinyl-5-enolpyruvyl-6-hydroxy-3-cyclohexene-1-carboxylate synthase